MSTDVSQIPDRVMVVDDDAVNLILASEVLGFFGVEAATFQSGREALTDFERRCFKLVLLDLHMPGLNGLEVADRMRAVERAKGLARTPIVALTAAYMLEDQRECLEHGMDAVLAKPFSFKSLKDELVRWSVNVD